VDTVVDTDGYTTKYDLATDGYDPQPLLIRRFYTDPKSSCVMAQLSVHTLTGWGYGDDFAAFQVVVDGLPMYGHTTACATNNVNVPCILADNTSGVDSHSYHLVLPNVTQGWHTIEVHYAGVDTNGSPSGAYVGGSILTIHHE
jgi:hypothetical protein